MDAHIFGQVISRITSIPYPNKGSHHPSTIHFWQYVQANIIEYPDNCVKDKLEPEEYEKVRRIANKFSNHTPYSNTVQMTRTENHLNGFDT